MKIKPFIIIVMLALSVWCSTAFASIKDAEEAYARHDYKLLLQQLLRPLVDKNDPEALFMVGLLYDNGEGVEQNYNKAKEWYLKAANLGYAPAQNNLGWVFQMGTSTYINDKEAAKWYIKSADQGYAPAQYNLGLLYFYGKGGMPKDSREASSLLRKAAEQGYAPAQTTLAKMYQYGQGVLVSLVQAYKWISLASDSGSEVAKADKEALEKLMSPDMIAEGKGLVQDWLAKRNQSASVN